MSCRYNRAYATFLKTMKIELLAGRHFDANRAADSSACIVNETFINVAGWSLEEAIGKRVWDLNYTIIGVCKDFHEQSPFTKIKPYFLLNHPGYLTKDKDINIRIEDVSNKNIINDIKIVLEGFFPESNFELGPYDENTNNGANRVYLGMAKTFGFFSGQGIP